MQRFTHTCFQVMPYEPYVALAERLNALAPGEHPKKSLFLTSGAEAVENAVKIARAHTGRSALIAFHGGYHGRTMMTLGLTALSVVTPGGRVLTIPFVMVLIMIWIFWAARRSVEREEL